MKKDMKISKDKLTFLKTAKKYAKIVSLSLFLSPPLISGEPGMQKSETPKETAIIKSTETSKSNIPAGMKFSNEVKKPRHFYSDLEEKIEKDRRIEKKVKAIMNAKYVNLENATGIAKNIESPDKEKMLNILNELDKRIQNKEIKTYKETIDEEGNISIEPIDLPFNITHYPYPKDEEAMIIFIKEDMTIGEQKIEKGTYIIYQTRENLKIEK